MVRISENEMTLFEDPEKIEELILLDFNVLLAIVSEQQIAR
jgi:hypothetical protein